MPRKVETVGLDASFGRDASKQFVLTEMPATQAEKWAIRALLALTRAGVDVPEDVQQMGMAAVASIGLHAFGNLSFEDAEPLLDEMMGCVELVPDPSKPLVKRPVDDEDVEEVKSRLFLRSEVIKLHTGFSIADTLSKSRTVESA